jgi:predicted DNA-binding transcriptional regulator YafY
MKSKGNLTRTERLLALAELLRARRTGVTAQALADRFDVTIRTIHRDLDALRMANLPISSERGRGGGFSLDASYTLPPVNFTAREAALLLTLTRYASDMRLLPFAKTLSAASDKVRAALSTSAQRELARRLDELAFVGVPSHPVASKVAQAVERAWFEQSELEVHYPVRNYEMRRIRIRVRGLMFDRSETRVDAVDATGRKWQLRLHLVRIAEV